MKTLSIQKASYNELEEILTMCGDLQNIINQYLHVSDYLPIGIKNDLENFRLKTSESIDKLDEA